MILHCKNDIFFEYLIFFFKSGIFFNIRENKKSKMKFQFFSEMQKFGSRIRKPRNKKNRLTGGDNYLPSLCMSMVHPSSCGIAGILTFRPEVS